MRFRDVQCPDVAPIIRGDQDSLAARTFPFYPLDAPGMPPPGPDFIQQATLQATAEPATEPGELRVLSYPWCLNWLHLRALYDPTCAMPIQHAGKFENVRLLLGHIWGATEMLGPTRPMDGPVVMVVGKNPGREELGKNLNFCGPTSQFFKTAMADVGIHHEISNNWYVTNLVRWINFDQRSNTLPAKWIKDCLPLLHQELRLVYPDFLLLLGAEATKAVLCNRQIRHPDGSVETVSGETLKSMIGRHVELQIPRHASAHEPEEYHTMKVMAITHPAAVCRTPELQDAFKDSLSNFKDLLECGEIRRKETPVELRYVYTERELTDIVSEILSRPGLKRIAVDAEWQGEYPGEPGSYLRTIQFTDRGDRAIVVVLSHQGGAPAFYPSAEKAYAQIKRLLDRDDIQYIGHFPASDIPWLQHAGIDIVPRLVVPGTFDELNHGMYPGVFATDLAEHAIDETAEFKLELVAMRRLGVQRWDTELNRWKKGYCAAHDLNEDDLEGYGECPAEILLPYSGYDVAHDWRLADEYTKFGGLLDRDRFGHSCWVPFHQSMIAFPAFLEMHLNGMRVDRERFDTLVERYEQVLNAKVSEFRQEINWPDFNPNSTPQCRALLFGDRFGQKKSKTGGTVAVRPPDAVTLMLTPIKSSGKRGKDWAKVVNDKEDDVEAPSTDKEVLGILGASSPLAAKLRDIRFIQKVLSGTLCKPERTKKLELILDADGRRTYKGGIISHVCCDSRVHGRFSQTMETGRANSWNPNLQNISNKRECYSADTEFLTARGWVAAGELREDDRVAQYWPGTKKIDFVRPQRLVSYPCQENLVHLHNDVCDLLVTADHRCLLESKQTGRLAEFKAGELPKTGNQFVAGFYDAGEQQLSEPQIILLAATQADGHWHRQGHLEFGFRKARKYLRLKLGLDRLGAAYTEPNSSRGDLRIRLSQRENPDLVAWLRGLLVNGKQFSQDLLHTLTADSRRLLAEEVFLWDGSVARGNSYYVSELVENLDFVHALFTLVGWRSVRNVAHRKVYCHVRRSDKIDVSCVRRELVPYSGNVYCVTVPSSWVVVRRNGRTAVCGNTDYERIAGDLYLAPLRTMFVSDFDGVCGEKTVIIGADYSGAELLVEAVAARCARMIDHCLRSALPDDHPDKYDIHSNIAVQAFRLQCDPSKKGLKSIGKAHLRIAAKNVVFGSNYGRSAAAIARQCKEEGTFIEEHEAQALLDALFEMYAEVPIFQDACRKRAIEPCWMCNPFGRRRRVTPSEDRKVMGEIERQLLNFIPQSTVADAVDRALYNLTTHSRRRELGYRTWLQLHDAIYLEVPARSVDAVFHEVMPECMVSGVSFRSCNLDGVPYTDSPEYRFSIDRHVYVRWGEGLSHDMCNHVGISAEYAHEGGD